LAFKILRNTGWLEKLKTARNKAKDKQLSIIEEETDARIKKDIDDFVKFCINWLGISNAPSIKMMDNQNWSSKYNTFGKFDARNNEITVNIGGRHPVDAMRTIAHELVHFAQNQAMPLPPEAGETGSRWENNANATAGEIMRDYVDHNPSAFSTNLSEASGYIPKNSKEANDPRFSHGLTVDIKPGEIQRQAAKLGLSTDITGVPPLLGKKTKSTKNKNNLSENYSRNFKDDDLLEVEMSPSALQTWLNSDKSEGIRVGFEAEVILPGVSDNFSTNEEDKNRIPASLEEVLDFFAPKSNISRRDELEDSLVKYYIKWGAEKFNQPEEEYTDEELMDFIDENLTYEQWFEEKDITLYDIARDLIEYDLYSLVDNLENVLGRDVYIEGRGDKDSYTIVSDESISAEEVGEQGIEIVSPPLPLQEMLDDLSKLEEFLNIEGAKTNASTGLHINISVPDSEKVDYVKLVLFSGDDYILKQFNRSYNTYASSALRKMTQSFKLQPDVIKQAFDAIKNGLASVASELLRQDVGDEKYTSIHIQKGYMEVRSPGNDWLAKDTDDLLNTALRYARAMSIASDPDAEKKEYLKKLYKLVDSDKPAESIFAQYAAGKISKENLMKEWARKTLNSDMWDGVGPGETVNYYKVSNAEKTVIIRDKSPDGAKTKAVMGGDFDPKDAQNLTIEKIDDEDVPKELEAQKRRDSLAKRIVKKLNKLFTYNIKRPDGQYLLHVVSSNSDEAWDKIDAHPLVPANPVEKDQQAKLVSVDPAPDDAHSTDFKVKRRSFFAKILIRLGGVEDTIGPIEVRAPSETSARDRIDRVLGKKVKQKYGENAIIQAVEFADSMGKFNILEEQSQKPYQPLKESLTHIDQSNSGGDLEAYVVNTSAPNMSNYLESQGVDQSIIQNLIKSYNTVGIIKNMHVDDEKRGRGYGSDLMNKAIDSAYDNKAEAVILISDTAESNEFDLTGWYKNYGFEVIGNASGGDLLMILDEG